MYCSTEDIQALTGLVFTASTTPTLREVGTLITDVSADIDGILGAAHYTVPVADPEARRMLRGYVKFGVAVRAWFAGRLSDDEPPNVTYWKEEYRSFVARLRSGDQRLPGLTPGQNENTYSIAFAIERDTD